MEHIEIRGLKVSRFILGSNPFSGYSHQTPDTDRAMMRYYTVARIKETLRQAEDAGVNTLIARADHHVMRFLMEYEDEGGSLQWFAQTCPQIGTPELGVQAALRGGAKACHVHGGVMDFLLAQGRIEEIPPVVDLMHEKGLAAGIAGHNPEVFRWAESVGLDVDYYMCSYYNAAHRDKRAEHVSGMKEWFHDADREAMGEVIATLSKPVIHYKIMAAGRNDPREAFEWAARHMRPGDAVCVGVYTADAPDMIAEDVRLLDEALEAVGEGAGL